MNQEFKSDKGTANQSLVASVFSPRSLVWHGLGWLGGLGVLSGSVFAQTPVNPVSTAQAPVETKSDSKPAPQPTFSITPQSVTLPEVAPQPDATPDVHSPSEPSPVTEVAPPIESNGAYIDSTNYNIGSTDYVAPNSVVLTNRSAGCNTTLNQSSALASSLCQGMQPPSVTTASSPGSSTRGANQSIKFGPVTVSSSGGQADNGVALDAQYYNPQISTRPLQLQRRIAQVGRLLFPLWVPSPITSPFGWRIHPITGDMRFHSGVDMAAPIGTPVIAAYAGRVVLADLMGGYGLTVSIGHNNHLQGVRAQEQTVYSEETLYGHLSEIFVHPGDWVEQGTVIGLVGSTGMSTGPHLHFELRQATAQGWVTVDPGADLQEALAYMVQPNQYAQASPEEAGDISSTLGIWTDASTTVRATSTIKLAQFPGPVTTSSDRLN